MIVGRLAARSGPNASLPVAPQGSGILGKGDAEEGEDFLGVTAIIAEGFRNRALSCPMQHADDGIAQDRHGAWPVAFVEID